MQTTIETLGQLERRMTMAVPAEEIERQVGERLKRLARTVKMAGFRPGKVPLKIVEQQYGPQVRSEVIGDAIEKAFSEAVRGQNLRVAGYPRIEPKQGADAGQLEFSATFEVYPEVALGDIGQAVVERQVLAVSDAEVEKTIEVLRKQRRAFEPVDRAAAEGDRVTIDFTGTIDGVEFQGGKGTDAAFVLGEGRMLPDFEKAVTGVAALGTKKFDLKFPDDYGGKDVAGKSAVFEVVVKKVEAPRLPDLDGDFARSLGVADGDLAKMRAEVKANVEREVKKRLGDDLKQKVMQSLLDHSTLELPKSLVDMELQRLVNGARADLEARGLKMENIPLDPTLFEAQAKRRVALGLIIAELVKSKGLAAKPEQVRALVDEQAASYEQPDEVVKWFYSQPDRVAEFEALALEQNVVEWVLGQAKVSDKPVAFDELMGKAA
ncbi:MAG: trigger factor [Burkholderiales bacterium]|jgi:trigger factor|nr:trigger factor [Burkholderiales bacterium]